MMMMKERKKERRSEEGKEENDDGEEKEEEERKRWYEAFLTSVPTDSSYSVPPDSSFSRQIYLCSSVSDLAVIRLGLSETTRYH